MMMSPQIQWKNRLVNDNGSRCKVTVDGDDFRIFEPRPFNRRWFTKKFKGPGLRFEVSVSVQTGWIVWVNGPFPCGSWPDLKIWCACLWVTRELLLTTATAGILSTLTLPGNALMHLNRKLKRLWLELDMSVLTGDSNSGSACVRGGITLLRRMPLLFMLLQTWNNFFCRRI